MLYELGPQGYKVSAYDLRYKLDLCAKALVGSRGSVAIYNGNSTDTKWLYAASPAFKSSGYQGFRGLGFRV